MSASATSRQRRPGGGFAPRADRAGFGPRFVIAISAGSVLNPVNSSIIAVALVAIGHAFAAGAAATTWLVSALYLATAIGQPAMGRLADQLGPRRVYLVGLVLVAAGGLLGWWGPSLGVLVAARVILGAGTSAAYPAAMAMVRRQAQRLHRDPPGSVLGALAVAGQATMAVGPPLGGLLIALGGWRLTFVINVPLALAGAAFAVAWLPGDEPHRLRLRALDLPGAALFAATLTALMLFLMHLRTHPWWLLAVAALALAALTRRELAARSPFVDVRMLARNRALTTTYLRFGGTMLVTYCFIYGWTLWLEQGAGRPASVAGLLMMPSFAAAAGVSALAARSRRIWPLLVAGSATLTAGSTSMLFLRDDSTLWVLAAVSIIFGVQNGLSVVTNQAAMYSQAPAAQTGAAAGLLRTFMYLGAIASAGIIGFAFGARATDAGLHHLALILIAASAVLLTATLADRDLHPAPGPQPTPGPNQQPPRAGHTSLHDSRSPHDDEGEPDGLRQQAAV
jgi:MFS family permease